MPNIIYNEGRVVGFSAYEIYLRQHLAELGDAIPPASEREWLSSMLAGGSALLIKIPALLAGAVGTTNDWYYLDIPLPATSPNVSRLCAANTIEGYLFDGHGNYSNANCPLVATSVKDYGDLIANNSVSAPPAQANDTTSIDVSDTAISGKVHTAKLYTKIIDGVVIQPGTWSANTSADNPPEKYLKADLQKSPTIRLQIAVESNVDFDEDVEILLVGWTNRSVVVGEVGQDMAAQSSTPSPLDGDFLGPAMFPWASKIVFTTPSLLSHVHTEEIEDLQSDLEGVARITTEYQDIEITGTGIDVDFMEAPNGLLVIHKSTPVPNTDPVQYTTEDVYALALSESDRQTMDIDDSTRIVNDYPDGFIYWEHLLPALHKKVAGHYGKVDALSVPVREFDSEVAANGDGQYVINVDNGHVTFGTYVFSEDDMIKQKINLIPTLSEVTNLGNDYGMYYTNVGNTDTYHDTANTKPLFAEAKLDLFGYLATYNNGNSDPSDDTTVLNMLATLTLVASPNTFDQPCVAWAQRFRIHDSVNLVSILQTVLELRKSTTNTGSNTLLLATGGRPVLRTASTIWDGSPLVHMDVVAYINLSTIAAQLNAWETNMSSHGKIVKITGAAASNPGGAHIEGVIYGTAMSTINTFNTGSNISTCSVNGSLAMSSKTSRGYNANSGTIQGVTAVFEDKTTDSRDISLV